MDQNGIILIPVKNCILRPVELNTAELQCVLAVYHQCEDFLTLGPVASASLEMVNADLAHSQQDGGIFCVIENTQNAELLGVVDFVLAGFEGDPQLAFLSLLMIAAPYRSRGLGAAVVGAVEDVIRRDGRASAIRSGVQVNNPAAIRFWQRMGYTIISGAEPQLDGTVALRLWKHIQP